MQAEWIYNIQVVQSNDQSLHVGALWVIFMTASRNGDKQICSI